VVCGSSLAAYSFISPLLTINSGLAASAVPLVLVGYGLGAFVGSNLGGSLGARRPYTVLFVSAAATLLVLGALCLFLVLMLPRRRVCLALDPAVVGGGGDTEDPEDGLDPEAAAKLLHELHHRRRVGSSSEAKKALAALRISLTRLSSAFSRRSRRSSSDSLVVVGRSSRSPRSASS
jgi:hypothetical protein